jgi:hypothetical protein
MGAKSHKLRKGFVICEELCEYLVIYDEVIYDFAPDPSKFPDFILFAVDVKIFITLIDYYIYSSFLGRPVGR